MVVPGGGGGAGVGGRLHGHAAAAIQDTAALVARHLGAAVRPLLRRHHHIQVVLFVIYSIVLITNAFACRVATFNDCEDAAKELQKQIGEAREDLRNKGFNFEDKPEKKTD